MVCRIKNRHTFKSFKSLPILNSAYFTECRFVIRHITQTDTETETELLRRHRPIYIERKRRRKRKVPSLIFWAFSRYEHALEIQGQCPIQDFPDEGAPTPKGVKAYYLAQPFPKLYENKRNWTERRQGPRVPPPCSIHHCTKFIVKAPVVEVAILITTATNQSVGK